MCEQFQSASRHVAWEILQEEEMITLQFLWGFGMPEVSIIQTETVYILYQLGIPELL